jgi:hypothetical protein
VEQIKAIPEASKTRPKGSKMPPNRPEKGSQARGLQVEYRPLRALIPFARNPRTHSDEQVAQIAASIRELGLDGENGVIADHGMFATTRCFGDYLPELNDPKTSRTTTLFAMCFT